MSVGALSSTTRAESAGTISVRQQFLHSFRDPEYRHVFVAERVRSSVALQIRALRQAREMTQKTLGDAIGMAQTWVSKLENPDYGKLTVATLLRLAEAFDTDLEIKFRAYSRTLDSLPTQGPDYFTVPSFEEEFGSDELAPEDMPKVKAIEDRLTPASQRSAIHARAYCSPQHVSERLPRKSAAMAASCSQEQYGNFEGSTSSHDLAI